MLKSKRTIRIPVLPTTDERCGLSFADAPDLIFLAQDLMSLITEFSEFRSDGVELYRPVSNGSANLTNGMNFDFGNLFDGEPDLIHLIAALDEYHTWILYLYVLGYSMVAPVTDGVFQFKDKQGVTISGTPVAHDLWLDTQDHPSDNTIVVPKP